jgi:hypothetical protein
MGPGQTAVELGFIANFSGLFSVKQRVPSHSERVPSRRLRELGSGEEATEAAARSSPTQPKRIPSHRVPFGRGECPDRIFVGLRSVKHRVPSRRFPLAPF